jgi:hypothetical protein
VQSRSNHISADAAKSIDADSDSHGLECSVRRYTYSQWWNSLEGTGLLLGNIRGISCAFDRIFESTNTFAQALAEFGQFLGSKQQHANYQDHDQVHRLK